MPVKKDQPAAPPEERRRQHRVLAKSGLVLRDWHDVEPWCSQECNVEEYRSAPPASEPEEVVLHKPDEGDEFAWTQCDGPDDICSDPRQSENWQHAVAVIVIRRKP